MTGRAVRLLGIVALVLAGAFALAVLAIAPGDAEFGYDSAAYYAAAARVREGEPLYPTTVSSPTGFRAYFYPPLVAVAFLPLTTLPEEAALLTWYAVLIGVGAAVGLALVRQLQPDVRPLAAAAYVSYLPLLSELRFGNVNLLTLAMVLLAWRLRDHVSLAGVLLAAGVGLKLLPLTLLVFLVVAGRGRLVAAAMAAGVVAVAVSWPWLGTAWLDYLVTLRSIGLGAPASGSNIVPELLAAQPARYVLPALSVCTALAAGVFARRNRGAEQDAFGIALAAAPLLATTVWYPYLVLALPAVLAGSAGRGVRVDVGGRTFTWIMVQARTLPLPLLGLAVLIATRLATLARGRRWSDAGLEPTEQSVGGYVGAALYSRSDGERHGG